MIFEKLLPNLQENRADRRPMMYSGKHQSTESPNANRKVLQTKSGPTPADTDLQAQTPPLLA